MIARRGRLSWRETLDLLQPVCAALDYAHSHGVVHRDLKPANILVDRARGPVLTDFGFARLMGESSASLSASGGILGTPAYIAPEIWELDAATTATDVYALGCIAYEMVTGEVLFAGQTPMQAMRAHDRGPRYPQTWPEGVPAGFEAVLDKALARDPAARYPGAGAFWQAVQELEAKARATREAADQQQLVGHRRRGTEAATDAGTIAARRRDPAAQAAQGEGVQQPTRDRAGQSDRASADDSETAPKPDTARCPDCGHANRRGAQYCQACGRVLAASEASKAPRRHPALVKSPAKSKARDPSADETALPAPTEKTTPPTEPATTAPPEKRRKVRRFVLVVAFLLILCCCCTIALYALDEPLGEIMWEISRSLRLFSWLSRDQLLQSGLGST
jgi:serine/threonine-protein kinase